MCFPLLAYLAGRVCQWSYAVFRRTPLLALEKELIRQRRAVVAHLSLQLTLPMQQATS